MFYIGVLVIVMSTSFVLTLCFEMPFGGLEKIVMSKLLGGNKKKTTESPKKDEIKTTTKDSLKTPSPSYFSAARLSKIKI